MRIGVPKEIKTQEYRVGMVPGGVAQLVQAGHEVCVQRSAGVGAGFPDEMYVHAGARILDDPAEVWGRSDLVVKVKEPVPPEYGYFRKDLTLYTYLHLAAEPELTRRMAASGMTGIAYETIELADRTLPLLKPMSEVAGRMATQVGAWYLQKENGGRGVLLGGIPGVRPGRVVVIGAGVVGLNAAKMAMGLGADTYILDVNLNRLEYIDDVFHGQIHTVYSNPANVGDLVSQADLVVGAVLITGARAPRLVTKDMVKAMPSGSVIVDVAIDQGGCVETAHPTNHEKPTYLVDDVLHYCVTNMPGAVPRSSTLGLTNATLRYAVKLAEMGPIEAIRADPALKLGVNVFGGHVVYAAVAQAHDMPYTPLDRLF